ncbi:MAG: cupredoxin domain-containing protein, partial [Acidimicrobiales bacterium]
VRRLRRLRGVAVLVAAALLAACSGAAAGPPEDGARTVVIDVRFSRFSLGDLRVKPGETVRFVIRNHDPIPHELIVGDMVVQDVHEKGSEAHHGERPGEASVAAGATAQTRYTFLTAGTLFFGCHLPGHWAYGMQGMITVA